MCTPCPAREFRYAGMVATRVFPSPVFISAMLPSCRAMAPMTWTSKCRWPIVRRAASRTEANASGSTSSRLSPASRRPRNSSVFARSCSSVSSSISGSNVLTMRTSCSRRFSLRPSPNWPIFSRPNVVSSRRFWGVRLSIVTEGSGKTRASRDSGRSSGDLEQLLPYGVDHGLHPGVQVELLQDVADVVLHRVLRDVQVLGDVSVVHALGHQPEDLHLAVGQPGCRDLGAVARGLAHRGELVQELGRHGGRDPGLAGPHRADGVGHLL